MPGDAAPPAVVASTVGGGTGSAIGIGQGIGREVEMVIASTPRPVHPWRGALPEERRQALGLRWQSMPRSGVPEAFSDSPRRSSGAFR